MQRKLSFKARNREETQARILSAAVEEFSEAGFLGARVERIATRSDVTLRMIYHYFKSKAYLYATVLQHVYGEAAEAECDFKLGEGTPEEGMRRLVGFAFDHFAANPALIQLNLGENLLKEDYIAQAGLKRPEDTHLFNSMKAALKAGQNAGVFHADIDPLQLWLTIFALCESHLSHAKSLSRQHGADLADRAFLAARHDHVEKAVLSTLLA